jgi:hypothetical protein
MTRGQGGERRVRRQSLPSFGKFRRDLSHRQPTWTRLTQSTYNCQFTLTVGALVLQVTLNVQARTHAGLHSTESTCAVGRSTACPQPGSSHSGWDRPAPRGNGRGFSSAAIGGGPLRLVVELDPTALPAELNPKRGLAGRWHPWAGGPPIEETTASGCLASVAASQRRRPLNGQSDGNPTDPWPCSPSAVGG